MILITGLVLGAIQLVAGVAIGLWLGRTPGGNEDRKRAQRLATDLRTLTAGLSREARQQADVLQRMDTRLKRESATVGDPAALPPLTSLVTGVIREMVSANEKLQHRLANAELEIESHAAEAARRRKQASTDPLTGLPNRRGLEDHLQLRMEAWRRHETPFSLVMVDVDHFKRFNDTYGHAAGDAALRAVGQALQDALRKHDVVARYGGEEFTIILPYTTVESAQAAVRKAVHAVAHSPVSFGGQSLAVTISAGLASVGIDERADDLIQRADKALYAAKADGRNRGWLHDGAQPRAIDPAPLADPPGEADPTLAAVEADLRECLAAAIAD